MALASHDNLSGSFLGVRRMLLSFGPFSWNKHNLEKAGINTVANEKEGWGINIQYVNHPAFTQYLICKYSLNHPTSTMVLPFSAMLGVMPVQRPSGFSCSRKQYNL